MKRLLACFAMAALAVAGFVMTPSAAQAGPTPPYGCSTRAFADGTYQGAAAWCLYGYGWYRATARCENDSGAAVNAYGRWIAVAPMSQTSVAVCPSSYPYVVYPGYQTQGV